MKRALLFFLAGLLIAGLFVIVGPSLTAQDPQDAGEQAEEELETFTPTEKLSADSEVAFPVDI